MAARWEILSSSLVAASPFTERAFMKYSLRVNRGQSWRCVAPACEMPAATLQGVLQINATVSVLSSFDPV